MYEVKFDKYTNLKNSMLSYSIGIRIGVGKITIFQITLKLIRLLFMNAIEVFRHGDAFYRICRFYGF